MSESLFNEDYMGAQAEQLKYIRTLINLAPVNKYDTNYPKAEIQTPSVAVRYVNIPIDSGNPLVCAESGETQMTFYPQTGLGHLEEMFVSITPSVTGANATPCELWPYVFFYKLSIVYGEEQFYNQIDPAYLLAYKFSIMNNNKRDQLLNYANDVTPWVVGVPHAPSTMVFPTFWSLMINNTINPPLPAKALLNQLTFTLYSRRYKDWLTAYTPATTVVTLNMTIIGKCLTYYGSKPDEPGIGHSDAWICASEGVVLGHKAGDHLLAVNGAQNIDVKGLDTRKIKAIHFYARKDSDYPNPTVATVGPRLFFRGCRLNEVDYSPGNDPAWSNLNTPGLLGISQLSSCDGMEWYNTVNSTITNTWTNNYLWTPGGHINVHNLTDIDGTYWYNTGDATIFTVTPPVDLTLYMTAICFQIAGIVFESADKKKGKLMRLYGYGASK